MASVLVLPTGALAEPDCRPMDTTIVGIVAPPDAYVEFCMNYVGACELEGSPTIDWSPSTQARVAFHNRAVNQQTVFVSDWDLNGLSDVWDYPYRCMGDCEDYALEKRRRLVEAGIPSASLTLAIAFHTDERFPHTVLLVESDVGTWVLDNLDDDVRCWDATPYTFTRRERPDGRWERFSVPQQ